MLIFQEYKLRIVPNVGHIKAWEVSKRFNDFEKLVAKVSATVVLIIKLRSNKLNRIPKLPAKTSIFQNKKDPKLVQKRKIELSCKYAF